MPIVDVKVFYLEMLARPERAPPAPRKDLSVIQALRPTVSYYRYLYNTIGKDYDWYSRGQLSDAELTASLHDPRHELHVLYVAGTPAGMAEFDRRREGEIELVQFGLIPEFIGQGLGKWFLHWTVEKAWSYQPRRYWLHTCTLDHPGALSNYQKAGFRAYKEETVQRELARTPQGAASVRAPR